MSKIKREESIEIPKNHVQLLIIENLKGKILVDLNDSKTFKDMVVKPLSIKNEVEMDIDDMTKAFYGKYKIKIPADRVNKRTDFKIDEKVFHVFSVTKGRENISINGNFHAINKKEIVRNGEWSIAIKGIGKCSITESLKKALEACD